MQRKILGSGMLLFAILVGWSMDVRADEPCGASYRHGPLTRMVPQEFHGADFRPACRTHDACYSQPGANKEACDAQFYQDLMCACQNSRNPQRCASMARTMYWGTRVGGKKSFEIGQGWRVR